MSDEKLPTIEEQYAEIDKLDLSQARVCSKNLTFTSQDFSHHYSALLAEHQKLEADYESLVQAVHQHNMDLMGEFQAKVLTHLPGRSA
jgi:RecA-family ATPase